MMGLFINGVNVSSLVSNISWTYSLDTIIGELSFSVRSSAYGVGDKVLLKEGDTVIFRGIIVGESGKTKKDLTVFDYGLYFTKNEVIKQFRKISVYNAIVNLCDAYEVKCTLPNSLQKAIISKIYKDITVVDVIQDLLTYARKTTGYRYHLRVMDNVLVISDYWKEPLNITDIGVDYSFSRSIEEMYNSVVIVGSAEDTVKVLAQANDDTSIKKYGLLQSVDTVDSENVAQARQIAKNNLTVLNVVQEDLSISCKGDYKLNTGKRVIIQGEELKGEYLITEITHTYKNDKNYRCDLKIRGWRSFVLGN